MNFSVENAQQKLKNLNESQASIETISQWFLFHKRQAPALVQTWADSLQQAPEQRKLVFLYLANDILQNGRKKGTEFQNAFQPVLQQLLPSIYQTVNDKMKDKMKRLLDIWKERHVYSSDYITQLKLQLDQSTKQEKSPKREPKKNDFVVFMENLNAMTQEMAVQKTNFSNGKLTSLEGFQRFKSQWQSMVVQRTVFIEQLKDMLEKQQALLQADQDFFLELESQNTTELKEEPQDPRKHQLETVPTDPRKKPKEEPAAASLHYDPLSILSQIQPQLNTSSSSH